MKIVRCTIVEKENPNSVIGIVRVRPETDVDFTPGQYAFLSLDSEHANPYSIANLPHEDYLEFHFKDSGTTYGISHQVLHHKEVGDVIYLHGIAGDMTLNLSSSSPCLMIAGGIGISPFKPMLEQRAMNRAVSLYWGMNNSNDCYLDQLGKVKPVVCYADEKIEGCRYGMVADVLLNDFDDLSDYDVYIAGPPLMAQKTAEALQKIGLKKSQLFCDYDLDIK